MTYCSFRQINMKQAYTWPIFDCSFHSWLACYSGLMQMVQINFQFLNFLLASISPSLHYVWPVAFFPHTISHTIFLLVCFSTILHLSLFLLIHSLTIELYTQKLHNIVIMKIPLDHCDTMTPPHSVISGTELAFCGLKRCGEYHRSVGV